MTRKILLSPMLWVAVAVLSAGMYPLMVRVLTRHVDWLWVWKSSANLNFFLFLFMFGYMLEKEGKKRQWTRKKQWLVWAGSVAVLFLFFRVMGMKTIFG